MLVVAVASAADAYMWVQGFTALSEGADARLPLKKCYTGCGYNE